jgi:hypothetical protein
MKYTEEQEVILKQEYEANPSKETVIKLAEKLGFTPRSIVGKLSRMGIYQKVSYAPKYAARPIGKDEIVNHIAHELEADPIKLEGLAKSQKPALLYLEELLIDRGIISER